MIVSMMSALVACTGGTVIDDGTASETGSADDSAAPQVEIVSYEGPTLRINEVMVDVVADAAAPEATGDWLEIFNPNAEAVSLDGYGLDLKTIDELSDVWTFDATTSIEAGGFLYVACNGSVAAETDPTTDFGMELAGDRVVLYLVDATALSVAVVDEVEWNEAIEVPDSYARTPDGTDTWVHDATPTPGAANE